MSKKIINDSNINNVEESKTLSIIKFSAEWCGPCQMFKPVYNELSSINEDILFGEVDIDDEGSKKIVQKYSVNTVPTTIFIKDGKEIERFLGFKSKEQFEEIIKNNNN